MSTGYQARFNGKVRINRLDVQTLNVTGQTTQTNPTASSVANGLTASATQTRLGGTPITADVNVFSTVAASGNAATLPAAVAGIGVTVFNAGANPMAIFPNESGSTIDGGSAGASVTLTNAKRARFYCVAAGTWISAQLGVASA